jgi:hypothetical protein
MARHKRTQWDWLARSWPRRYRGRVKQMFAKRFDRQLTKHYPEIRRALSEALEELAGWHFNQIDTAGRIEIHPSMSRSERYRLVAGLWWWPWAIEAAYRGEHGQAVCASGTQERGRLKPSEMAEKAVGDAVALSAPRVHQLCVQARTEQRRWARQGLVVDTLRANGLKVLLERGHLRWEMTLVPRDELDTLSADNQRLLRERGYLRVEINFPPGVNKSK